MSQGVGRTDRRPAWRDDDGRAVAADFAEGPESVGPVTDDYRWLFEHTLAGYYRCRLLFDERGAAVDYLYLEVNPAFERLTGLHDVVGKTVGAVRPGILLDNAELVAAYGRVARSGRSEHVQAHIHAADVWFALDVYPAGGDEVAVVFTDVSDRVRAEQETRVSREFLTIVSESLSTERLVRRAVEFVVERADCDAVGVRLRKGDDYPYYETRGFSREFVLAESSLCPRSGECPPGAGGDPVLDCMCGNVIGGRTDPAQPFFTELGSFWSNGTSKFLAATSDEDRLTHTRNRCNGDGYESVLLVPLRAGGEPLGLLQLNARREGAFSPYVVRLWERVARHLAVALARAADEEALRELAGKLELSLASTFTTLGATVELRDPYTAGHQRRVAVLACAVAERLGCSESEIRLLRMAAQVHDVGKIGVPADILARPSRLTPAEFSLVKAHSGLAREILAPVDVGAPLAEIVGQHHERLDGSGYPDGLHGGQILPLARILAVADVAEAMISHRPYRPALPVEAAVAELRDGAGVRYDPDACRVCVELLLDESFTLD